jgi:cytochrome c peroxidase
VLRARLGLAAAAVVTWALAPGCGSEPENTDSATGGEAGTPAVRPDGGSGDGGQPPSGGAPAGGSDAGRGGEDVVVGGMGASPGAAGDGEGGSPEGGAAGAPVVVNPAYVWRLPKGFPTPVVPAENPMSEAKVELGRHLFYDVRLSGNQTQSCASCHRQELAFSDDRTVPLGSTGVPHPRNSMALANVAYAATLTWANPLLFTLESQALVPMFGTEPVELGLNGREAEMLERLRAEPRYEGLFADAYPGDGDPFTLANVTRALASFQRTLLSGNSPFDRYTYHGEADALSESAKRGRVLFNSEKLECFHCHSGFNLQDSVNFVGKPFLETPFHNTALYNVDGQGAYPSPNTGIFETTRLPADMGRFRVPTLRNVAVTAPYMHDGSMTSLDEVLDHYAAGGRTIADGPNAGVGSASPLKSSFLVGFTLSPEERADVLAFLESLTDTAFLTDPRFSSPWLP